MEEQMNKARFLNALQTERAKWDALLVQVGEERMTQSGVEGDLSIKDVIAHVTWYEREMVEMLGPRRLVGSELWNLPTDERNAAVFQENRGRPLEEVLTESRQVYQELLKQVESLSEEELHDPHRFADMPDEWVPWKVIASNSWEHYPDHVAPIRAWLEKNS